MKDIQVSLVASANRFQWWMRFYNSLKGNKLNWEVVFVGDKRPDFTLPDNFKYVHATVKPAQCYQIGFWEAEGELISWTADDADYNHPTRNCPNSLDIAYEAWKKLEEENGNDKKSIIAFRPIEDGGDVYRFHHFFGGWDHTPTMAPFGLLHRDYFVNTLGGYDADFVSGQSENDVVMRVLEDGGRVEICMDAFLYVHHRQVHPRTRDGSREDNKFRDWYKTDRKVLEDCWIPAGYGNYEKDNKNVEISKKRLRPVKRFEKTNDVTTVTQGIYKGMWT